MPDEDLIQKLRLELDSAGRAVAIARSEAASKKPKRMLEAEAFIHVTVREFLAGVQVLDGALELSVWIYLLRERRMHLLTHARDPVTLSNAGLATWGVSRIVRGRAIRKLESAGLVRVERVGKRSPHVTVLVPLTEGVGTVHDTTLYRP